MSSAPKFSHNHTHPRSQISVLAQGYDEHIEYKLERQSQVVGSCSHPCRNHILGTIEHQVPDRALLTKQTDRRVACLVPASWHRPTLTWEHRRVWENQQQTTSAALSWFSMRRYHPSCNSANSSLLRIIGVARNRRHRTHLTFPSRSPLWFLFHITSFTIPRLATRV